MRESRLSESIINTPYIYICIVCQQRAHSSSSSGSDDTIAFSVYAELRREFDMLQGKYDRLIDRLKNVYPDSRNFGGLRSR